MTLVEICIDDPGGELAAQEGGADRIELCAAVASGGVTPSIGTVQRALERTNLAVQVLVRPRPGNFVHDNHELDIMCRDILWLRCLARDYPGRIGVTTGAVMPDHRIDGSGLARLVEAADGLPVTFHRGFDECPDLLGALADLADAGVQRVLTAGGPGAARDHLPELRSLVAAGQGVEILAGGGVRSDNVAELVATSGVNQVHLRAQAPSSKGYDRTSLDLVAELVQVLASTAS